MGLLFLPIYTNCQPGIDQHYLSQKALLYKNRVEYDSALLYYNRLDDLLNQERDTKALITNRLNITDLLILQRKFKEAYSELTTAGSQINEAFDGSDDLLADFDQVKGSYFQGVGIPDSAIYYLKRSIAIRNALSGPKDTLHHYAYNKLGNMFIALSEFDSAYLYHKTALDISLKKMNPVNYLTASSYQNLGIAAHFKGDYQFAEDCYTKSLRLKEQLFNYNDPGLSKIYSNLGKFYTDLSKYNIALEYYDKSEQLLINKYDRNDLLFAHVYWNKGNVYTHKGDYVKATSYLAKAYTILETILGPDDQDVLRVLLDLGFAHDKKGDTTLAITYYNRAAKNRENAGIIKIYRNLGNLYMQINEQDSAEKYYQLSIFYAKKIFSGNSYDLALCYQYYGEFLAKTKNDPKAMDYYTQAADIFIQLFGGKNKDLCKVYRLQSEYYLTIGNYDDALQRIHAALIALLPGFSSEDPYVKPTENDFVLDIYLQDALQQKAITHYQRFKHLHDLKDLYASLDIIGLAITVTEGIRKTYYEEESQLILNKLARDIIDLGVTVSLELFTETGEKNYLKKAFNYCEKGQAIILLSALRGLEAQSNIKIPKEIQATERKVSEDLASYNNLVFQERQKKMPDQQKIQLWTNIGFNLRLSHDSILASYKKDYPDYFRLKFDYSSISADSAMKALTQDQAILEYCLTDSLVFGFLLANDKLNAYKLGQKPDLKSKLDSLRENFMRKEYFNAGHSEFATITSLSADLYDILIRPFKSEIEGKRLIIIPDGELGYLSFDILLNDKPEDTLQSYKDMTWLIRENPISYSSSATIYFEQSDRPDRKVAGSLIAFAPSYDFITNQRNASISDSVILKLSPLVGTKEEVNSISELFRSRKLFDEKATEEYFKSHAGEYGILHLAMHTIIDNQHPLYSKLVFTPDVNRREDDGYLNTYELFSLQLPGQLAVLSACNTGSGKLERGEGIMSLARGFFYAGIPNVVMTLWEIEDHSSADLMSIFYENLKQGKSSDIALQQAKIGYMQKAGKLHAHPYFWAGYVSIGKTSPIHLRPVINPFYYIMPGIMLLIIFAFLYFFINKRVFFHKKRN
jgi:CHAT domain-containing protein